MRTDQIAKAFSCLMNRFPHYMRRKPLHFLGVFAFDHTPYTSLLFPKERDAIICCVVNTDPSDRPGEHWVAFFRDSSLKLLEYFDSYGENPTFYGFFLGKSIAPNNAQIQYSNKTLQGYGSTVCGQYCVLFLFLHFLINEPSSCKDFSKFHSVIASLSLIACSSKGLDQKVENLFNALQCSKSLNTLFAVRTLPSLSHFIDNSKVHTSFKTSFSFSQKQLQFLKPLSIKHESSIPSCTTNYFCTQTSRPKTTSLIPY